MKQLYHTKLPDERGYLPNSLTRWGKEGDTYAKAFEKELLAKLNKK